MHIAIDAHLAVKAIDGITRYLIGLLEELPKLDRSIQYTVFDLPRNESGLPAEIFQNKNVKRLEFNLYGPSPKQHLVTSRILKKLNANIYHHPQYDLPLGINIPTVATIHDLKFIYHPEFLTKKSWVKSFYIKTALKHTLKRADKIIAVSQNTLNDIHSFFPIQLTKTHVIHHGVKKAPPGKWEKPPALANKDFVLFVGTRRPHKNIEGLIKAAAILKDKFQKDIHFAIAGKSYSDYQTPQQLCKKMNMEDRVHFLDFISDEALPNLYESAKIVILPSFYEGFGLPIIEAMMHGKPVIASNVTSLPEIVGDAGLLIDPHSPEDIAQKINTILESSRVEKELSEKALKRARLFSWNAVAEKTLTVYLEVAKANL